MSESMERVWLQGANMQLILQHQTTIDAQSIFRNQQGGINNNLSLFHLGGDTELEVGEPHQVGPPVSFISDCTTYTSQYHMLEHQNVNPYLYPSSFTYADTPPVYMHHSTYQQPSSLSTPQLLTSATLQSYTNSTTNLPNGVEVQLFDKMLEKRYLDIVPTDSKPAHQMFDKHSERVKTAERNYSVTLPTSSLLQDVDKNHGEHPCVLPTFDGTDPRGWILRACSYFEFKNKVDVDKIRLAGVHFEGRANLHGLLNLNLAGNYLSGRIPDRIGDLKSLESLDLSRNELHGPIPQSLSDLNFLSHLNLSFNAFIRENSNRKPTPDPQ